MNIRNTMLAKALVACVSLSTLLSGSAQAADVSLNGPASQAYLKFHEIMLKCKGPEEIWPYLAENRVKQMQADKAKLPAKEFAFMFDLMKSMTPPKVRILAEAMHDKSCVLTVDAPDYKDPFFSGIEKKLDIKSKDTTTGKVTLVEENGVWKVEKEQWKSTSGESAAGDSKASGDTVSNTDSAAPTETK
jgi:hypothetical protein